MERFVPPQTVDVAVILWLLEPFAPEGGGLMRSRISNELSILYCLKCF